MDNVIAEKFRDLGLTDGQIELFESLYRTDILPIISRHYLSHLVTTIEELINNKKKQAFLEHIKSTAGNNYPIIKKAVNHKILRLFSIILVPVESGKLNARTYFIRGDHSVMITYWKQLPEDQIRILIAHELGHVAIKYLFGDAAATSDNRLATLFGFIALQDRNHFYRNRAKDFTRGNDLIIYDEIANICNRRT
jgi:hypothetical protein